MNGVKEQIVSKYLKIINDASKYKRTKYKKYSVLICKPNIGTELFDKFIGKMQTTTPSKPIEITDTLEQSIAVSFEELEKHYTDTKGNVLTKSFLKSMPEAIGDYIYPFRGVYNPSEEDVVWALHVPLSESFLIDTMEGRQFVNMLGMKHGDGDFIVAPDKNGVPDLEKRQVVNGLRFEDRFDMRAFRKKGV